jgi:hypothetical protein
MLDTDPLVDLRVELVAFLAELRDLHAQGVLSTAAYAAVLECLRATVSVAPPT